MSEETQEQGIGPTVCVWEQRDDFKQCTVCGRRYYGPAENPYAICGGHKVHGPTLRVAINVPARSKPETAEPTSAARRVGCNKCGERRRLMQQNRRPRKQQSDPN